MSASGFAFRAAWDDERARVAQLFSDAAAPGDCFVAVRERPVERIVGAAFWRETSGPDGGRIVEFSWGALPVLADSPAERDFLLALRDALVDQGRTTLLRSAGPLPDCAQARLLQNCGFEPAYRQDCYLGEWESWLRRTHQVLARLQRKPRATDLEVASPAPAHAEALADLAARRHKLLPAQEVHAALATSGGATKFDPRYSALLFQGERLVGACLAKLHERQISIPVLVVDSSIPAGEACARLFEHCQRALAGEGVSQVLCRTNPEMSPTMPRLARRFDAHLVGTLTAWQLALGTSSTGGAGGSNASHPSP